MDNYNYFVNSEGLLEDFRLLNHHPIDPAFTFPIRWSSEVFSQCAEQIFEFGSLF